MSDNLIGATTAIFIVSLSIAVTEPVDVAWSTRDGTAKAGTDYQAASGVVSFLPGETQKQIEVIVYGQNVSPTGDKNFFINLMPPTNAVLGTTLIEAVIKVEDESGVPVTSVIVAQGKRGLKGDPGLSAYEQAVLMGYDGTLEDWMQEQADAAAAAQRASDYAANAAAAATKAENAATAASFLGNIFPTPEAGVDPVTGVGNGAYYNVRSPSDDAFLEEYQNIGGVPTPTGKTYPSSAAIEQITESVDQLNNVIVETVPSIAALRLYAKKRPAQSVILRSYVEGYEVGGGEFYADDADTTSADNGVTIIVGADGTRWKRKAETITFADAGCINGADSTAAIKRAFEAIGQGWKLKDDSESSFTLSSDVLLEAPFKKVVIDSNCKVESLSNKITVTGTIFEVGVLSADAVASSKSATLSSVADLQVGDVVILHNTRLNSFAAHTNRSYYTDGEFKTIAAISGNVVTFNQFLETSYVVTGETPDTVKVYKVSPVFADIKGLKCIGNGANAFTLSLAYKSKLDFFVSNLLNASNSNNALLLDRVYDSEITGGEYIKLGISAGTAYGISISNCQDIVNRAKYAYGGRHGVAVGGRAVIGSVPNRRVNTISVKIENDPASELHAADFHGNTADSYYKNCEILGRISLSGYNTKSIGNRIHSQPTDVRAPIGLSEVVGGNIESIGDEIVSSGSASFIMGWLGSDSIPFATKETTFRIQDIKFKGNANLVGISSIFNMSVKSNQILDGFELIGNLHTIKFDRLLGYTVGALSVKPSYIQITRPNYAVPESMFLITGDAGLADITKQVFSQSGKNTNGKWIKQSDGSMICRHRVTATMPIDTAVAGGFKSANIQWTYPKVFVEAPTIIATSFDNSSLSIRAASAGTSSAQLYSFSTVSIASTGINFDVVAIGRHLS